MKVAVQAAEPEQSSADFMEGALHAFQAVNGHSGGEWAHDPYHYCAHLLLQAKDLAAVVVGVTTRQKVVVMFVEERLLVRGGSRDPERRVVCRRGQVPRAPVQCAAAWEARQHWTGGRGACASGINSSARTPWWLMLDVPRDVT